MKRVLVLMAIAAWPWWPQVASGQECHVQRFVVPLEITLNPQQARDVRVICYVGNGLSPGTARDPSHVVNSLGAKWSEPVPLDPNTGRPTPPRATVDVPYCIDPQNPLPATHWVCVLNVAFVSDNGGPLHQDRPGWCGAGAEPTAEGAHLPGCRTVAGTPFNDWVDGAMPQPSVQLESVGAKRPR